MLRDSLNNIKPYHPCQCLLVLSWQPQTETRALN